MKIVIATPLYPPDIGGPATYTKLLESELPKRGVSVEVVKFSEVRHLPKVVRHIVYFYLVFKAARGADLVYAQDPVSVGLPACLGSFFAHRPFMLKVVGDYAWEQGCQRWGVKDPLDVFAAKKRGYGLRVGLFKIMQSVVAGRADRIVVPSQYLKSVLVKWGIEPDKVSVILNAFEPVALSTSREDLRQELALHQETLVSVGRLVPWKGFTKLIEAVHQLRESIPEIVLIIIGEGPEELKLQSLIQKNNLTDTVRLVGKLDRTEVFKYLKAADLFILNTKYEGLSHQLLEAMSLRIPIITTDVGGNPEVIESGVSGVLIEPDNVSQIMAAILWLLKSESTRNRLAGCAEASLQRFTLDKMLTKLTGEMTALCTS